MNHDETLRLIAALADAGSRNDVLRALIGHLRARAIYVFTCHPDAPERLIPATGFAPSLPSSRGWRELLARCVKPGPYTGLVAFPTAQETASAVAYAYSGFVFTIVGHAEVDRELDHKLAVLAPLFAAMLEREQQLGVLRGELAVARDATQRASALATALDLARAEAERATRVKDEFLAILGHELRNPLAPIVTALQLLRMEGRESRIYDMLDRQVSHLLRLVDDLLDVSRITRGKAELRKAHIEIHSAVQRGLEIARPLLENKRMTVVVDVPERGLRTHADPARIAQVLANLLTNAAKYSDPEKHIRVRAERAGSFVRITIEDQGIGLAADMLERVFDQFVQVPQASDRAAGGLGLGLAIVRSLVTLHGGSVRALSEGVGHGSAFVVELPFDETAAEAEAAAPAITKATADQETPVLIVDDNRDAAEMLGQILESFGYQVRLAHDGPEALETVNDYKPSVALLDIGLPIMDGYELARALRSSLPNVRLVAVTGYGQAGDRERAINAGFDAHLVKPVSIGSVTETLDKLLHR